MRSYDGDRGNGSSLVRSSRATSEKRPLHTAELPDYPFRQRRCNPDQSFAGIMRTPLSDINLSTANAVIKMIEGENDGLVSVESAKWGESFTLLKGRTNRGVSHYDEIDFRRSPLSSKRSGDGIADICDVYKSIVKDLADRGF